MSTLVKRFLLRLALGKQTWAYLKESVQHDPRTLTARQVDIVVRKDGLERRIEADWVKNIAKLLR